MHLKLEDDRYYMGDGCPFQGSTVDDRFQPQSFQGGIRCCSDDGKSCQTPGDCPKNSVSYEIAAMKCQNMGLRLCTKYELLSGVCCSTGGNCDSHLVWTSTSESGTHLNPLRAPPALTLYFGQVFDKSVISIC